MAHEAQNAKALRPKYLPGPLPIPESTNYVDPREIQRRLQMASALRRQGAQQQPNVNNGTWQGALAHVINKGVGSFGEYQAGQAQKQAVEDQAANTQLRGDEMNALIRAMREQAANPQGIETPGGYGPQNIGSEPVKAPDTVEQVQIPEFQHPDVQNQALQLEIGRQGRENKFQDAVRLHEATQAEPKVSQDIEEYNFAKEQDYPGSFFDYQKGLRKSGATNISTTVGGLTQTKGRTKVDEDFAKEFNKWELGGAADVEKSLSQLNEALGTLESGENITGPLIGVTPDTVQALTNPQALDTKDAIEEVVQRNLRLILGAQFTEKEGSRLIARAYNTKLSEPANAKRIRRLIRQISLAAQSKDSAAQYWKENGTLTGWQGRLATLTDVRNVNLESDFDGGGQQGVSEDDIQETMRANGMTREQVMERLNAR